MWSSLAPLKLTTISTMVEGPQFGAQKAAGSSNKACNQGWKMGTNMSDSRPEQRRANTGSGTFPGHPARPGFCDTTRRSTGHSKIKDRCIEVTSSITIKTTSQENS